MQAFQQLGLDPGLLRGIEALGYETPTPIQEAVIPAALTLQRDLIALAQTGTGKTAAFGLPLLQRIDPAAEGVQALILCPTRELCIQVASDLANYSRFARQYKIAAVYGGANIRTQITEIKEGANIIVATPGRLIDLMERRAVLLDQVRRVVLDEADEMLNMGFQEDLNTILGGAVNREAIWLFSATMSREVRAIASNYMRDPEELSVGTRNQANENIEHHYYLFRPNDRFAVLKRIVDALPGIYGLIFCRTKMEAKEVSDQLARDGYNADALHGDMAQTERDRVMNRFREGALQLLVATDVAARGIDVSNITHVIHYGLPDDPEVYTHRSGRTGRAGKKGISIALVPPAQERRIHIISKAIRAEFQRKMIPTGAEVCERQLLHIIRGVHDIEVRRSEIEPFLPQVFAQLESLSREEIILRFASVEFNRFLQYYQNAEDLNLRSRGREEGSSSEGRDMRFRRLFVSIGEADGVTKKDFLEDVSSNIQVPRRAIGQIDLRPYYLHFDVAEPYLDVVRAAIQTWRVNNKPVRVDDATVKKERGAPFPQKEGFRPGKKAIRPVAPPPRKKRKGDW
jgi:ATP-dependent RNA helicase DeaD